MNIGLRIRELRKKRGMTQEQLAEYLNISPRAVSEWENGTAPLDRSLVPQLVSLFEVSEEEFFSPDESRTDKRVLLHALRLAYGI